MYARRVDDQILTFAVSGMLWDNSVVLQDQETKSLWCHILGQAMDGPLKGRQLPIISSHLTDWATWRKLHPTTTVVDLPRTSQEFQNDFYRDPSRFVLGIVEGGQAKAWTFEKLIANPVLNDDHAGVPLVVFFDPASTTALAFQRRLDDQTLTFERQADRVVDRETQSVWEPLSGRAIAGKLAGRSLTPLPAIVSYASAWVVFHPETAGLTDAEKARARKVGGYRGSRTPPAERDGPVRQPDRDP